jgi:hypothetical protein
LPRSWATPENSPPSIIRQLPSSLSFCANVSVLKKFCLIGDVLSQFRTLTWQMGSSGAVAVIPGHVKILRNSCCCVK